MKIKSVTLETDEETFQFIISEKEHLLTQKEEILPFSKEEIHATEQLKIQSSLHQAVNKLAEKGTRISCALTSKGIN